MPLHCRAFNEDLFEDAIQLLENWLVRPRSSRVRLSKKLRVLATERSREMVSSQKIKPKREKDRQFLLKKKKKTFSAILTLRST